jgi:UbiD family decarboxylase
LRGEKKFEVAVVIGADPTVFLASQFVPSMDVDEFTIAGALRKAPVELVPCETVNIECRPPPRSFSKELLQFLPR